MKRNEFFNTLNYLGYYPLDGFDLLDKSDTEGNCKFMYINMILNATEYGNSFQDIKEQIEEYKNQIAKGVIVYEIPFHCINFMILVSGYDSSYIPGEDTIVTDYTKVFSERLLSDNRLEKIIETTKYIWNITPDLFMANLNLLEDETYEIDYKNEKIIVTRTLTPNSFVKEALKIERVSEEDDCYTYRGIKFTSELSLHELRLQMGYDDRKECVDIIDDEKE